ncbi:MAG: DUF6483 family protein [Thermoflexales bacterium]|nr:DUF6483 family protein [Thermoflexales bacterium]MDW8352408.1 DUF6483 family protein [Anaerolineae bacterium]
MPYSQDYVKRMIEQFGEFLLALKQLLSEDRRAEAREQLDLAYRELLGMQPQFVRDAPDDYLILTTGMAQVGDTNKSIVLGDLLIADGDWHALAGEYEVAQTCYLKAANILIEALLRQPFGVAKDDIARVDELIEKLEHFDIPYATRERLFRYHERVHRFADAEDDLYQLLDAAPDDVSLIEAGIAFYERLLGLKDHELLLGGLPRDEVEAGLAELEARLGDA